MLFFIYLRSFRCRSGCSSSTPNNFEALNSLRGLDFGLLFFFRDNPKFIPMDVRLVFFTPVGRRDPTSYPDCSTRLIILLPLFTLSLSEPITSSEDKVLYEIIFAGGMLLQFWLFFKLQSCLFRSGCMRHSWSHRGGYPSLKILVSLSGNNFRGTYLHHDIFSNRSGCGRLVHSYHIIYCQRATFSYRNIFSFLVSPRKPTRMGSCSLQMPIWKVSGIAWTRILLSWLGLTTSLLFIGGLSRFSRSLKVLRTMLFGAWSTSVNNPVCRVGSQYL